MKNKIDVKMTRISWLVIVISILLALPAFSVWLGLAPEGDALDYRVSLVKWIAAHWQIPNWPWTIVDDYPLLGEVWMAIFYSVHPNLMRLVPLFAYMGLAWVAFEFSKTLFPTMPSLVAAAWIMGLRPLTLQANLLMVDNLASFFTLGALLYLIRKRWYVAGVWCAFSLATRYTSWVNAVPLFLVAVYCAEPKNRWRQVVSFVFISSIGALPFMVRNLILNHNPFFPLLSNIFNGVTVIDSYFGYGRGRTVIDFLLLPYDMLYTNTFVKGFFDYTLGKLFYLQFAACSAALAFLACSATVKLKNIFTASRESKALCIFFFAQLFVWFCGSQQMRFFVPGLVILNLSMLFLLWKMEWKVIVGALTLAVLLSSYSIQKDSILIAIGKTKSVFSDNLEKAKECFSHLEPNKTVGFVNRDGVQGFLDIPWVYYPPHGYATPFSYFRAPPPDYIYQSEPTIDGYEPWPKNKPCMLKRVSS